MRKILVGLMLFCCGWVLNAQTHIVTGVVSGEDGFPLPGVSVFVKGTNIGISTNAEGQYSLRVPNKDAILVFTMIGYKVLEIPAGMKPVINATLSEENIQLKETVILGYGSTQTKERLVGSVEQVKADNIAINKSAESFDKMLEGLVAGVYIDQESGEPGSAAKVRIRGQGSLDQVLGNDIVASSEPLYILDGVPLMDASEPNATNISGSGSLSETRVSPLALINPDDIESITVLKDASAAAIYGANASNGVILITTKKGKRGDAKIAFNQSVGISQAINSIQYLNTDQYRELAIETLVNSGKSQEEALRLAGPDNIFTDWQDLILRTGIDYKANLSISGGGENTTYRLSAGYNDSKAISEGNDLQRISTRLNMSSKLTEKLSLDYVIGFSTVKKNNFNAFSSLTYLPNLSPYNADGTFNNTDPFDKRANPLAALAQNENWSKTENVNGSAQLKYELLKGLSISNTFGVDYTFGQSYVFNSKENALGMNRNGYIREMRRKDRKWLNFTQADYSVTIAAIHSISALVGFQLDDTFSDDVRASESNLPIELNPSLGLAENEDSQVSQSKLDQGSVSVYSRVSYSYGNKYNLSLNFRRDASSIFGGDLQVANFMSAGASWVLSEENFLSGIEWIDLLKLKLSYGNTGNSRVGTYAARGLYRYNTVYSYNGQIGAVPSAAPNSNLTWEINKKLNVGLDFNTLRRFNVGIEFWQNNVEDAIMSVNTPYESGFASVSANAADIRNRGVDVSFTARVLRDSPLKWTSNFNIGFVKSKVLKLANGMDRISSSTFNSTGLKVGRELGLIIGARVHGVNPETGIQQWLLADGSITEDAQLANRPENRVVIGKKNPDFQGGFTNNLTYNNLRFSFLITYEWGADLILPYASSNAISDGRQILVNNQSVNQLDRWQKPGDVTDVPKLNLNNYPGKNNTRFMHDKSNVALKSVSLNYSLPKVICRRLHLGDVDFSANVANLFTWYREGNSSGKNGIAQYRYAFPLSRVYTFGLDLKF
ncbi:MAG: SusC/RagA family TonB-linked outer membrane protein [Breznakibacter sp.]|nr:SusC/RagA family TonB-linked outer membrane protein [Breznakibacter sp.]